MERLDLALVDLALREDLPHGDASRKWLQPAAVILAKVRVRESGLLCGTDYFREVYARLPQEIFGGNVGVEIDFQKADGEELSGGESVATVTGPLEVVLAGERTALNFLMRLSGLATHAAEVRREFPDQIRVLDTRKTTPGWRNAEKYAFRVGGIINHRHSLSQGVLLKDNHRPWLAAHQPLRAPLDALEVEIDNPGQLEDALDLQPDAILLDNFSMADLEVVLPKVPSGITVEMSGNQDGSAFSILYRQLSAEHRARINYVSVGRALQYARWLDFGMDLEQGAQSP